MGGCIIRADGAHVHYTERDKYQVMKMGSGINLSCRNSKFGQHKRKEPGIGGPMASGSRGGFRKSRSCDDGRPEKRLGRLQGS